MMKKIRKILLWIVAVLLIILLGGWAVLQWMLPDQRIKEIAQHYAKSTWNREITFEDVSLGFKGLTLTNFALSEVSSFEQGTFVQAQKLRVQISWLALLRKKIAIQTIRINQLEVNIVKNADGTFNFDSFTQEQTPSQPQTAAEENSSLSFSLTAKRFIVTGCDFNYKDAASGDDTSVKNINFEIQDFDLAAPFTTIITFTAHIKQKHQQLITIPARVDLTLFLAELNLEQAYVQLNQSTASYKNVLLSLSGKVENFQNPNVNITGTLSGIDHTVFADFLPDLPAFSLAPIELALVAQADLEHQTAQLTKAAVQLKDSSLSLSGPIEWSGENPAYKLSADIRINLAQAVEMTDTVDVRPSGDITGALTLTDKKNYQDIKGSLRLNNVSLIYDPFTLTNTQGTIRINSLTDIAASNITGLLNGEKLNLSFAYQEVKGVPSYTLSADLAQLKLTHFPQSAAESQADTQASEQTTQADAAAQTQEKKENEPETFFNVRANLTIGSIEVPYLRSDGLTLNADLTGLSTSMQQTNGQISFALQPGAITDIDTVLKGNKIVRFILLPFSIINSVAKKLNISLFEATSSARKGEIVLSSGEGQYVFKNGLMTVENTSFVSNLTDLKGSGTIDFPNNTLNMKVSASLLTKQTPIVIKIGGTLDNPSGKLDVLNTVGSVVGGILNYKTATGLAEGTAKTAGHVATGAVKTTTKAAQSTLKGTANAAKATAKALGGLFKKKSDTEDATEAAQEGETSPEAAPVQ